MARDTRSSTLRWLGKTQFLTTGAASAQSSSFQATTEEIRVVVKGTNGAYINIGDNPTAAATADNSIWLPPNVVEYFHVTPGQKLAHLQDTGSSTVVLSEMGR